MLIESGVDWLTATCLPMENRGRFRDCAYDILSAEMEAGNFGKPWRWRDYEGVTCGQVDIGERYDSAIVRLRGRVAAKNWRDVFNLSTQISRVDFQSTIRTDFDNLEWLGSILRRAEKRPRGQLAKPVITGIFGTDGAATVYFGSRQSSRFARIYEKGVESGEEHYRGCLRFELEMKGKVATANCRQASRVPSELAYVGERLREYFSRNDAVTALALERVYGPMNAACLKTSGMYERLPGSSTDCSRRLRWLESAVRPSILALIRRGMLPAVVAALGLSSYVRIREEG